MTMDQLQTGYRTFVQEIAKPWQNYRSDLGLYQGLLSVCLSSSGASRAEISILCNGVENHFGVLFAHMTTSVVNGIELIEPSRLIVNIRNMEPERTGHTHDIYVTAWTRNL